MPPAAAPFPLMPESTSRPDTSPPLLRGPQVPFHCGHPYNRTSAGSRHSPAQAGCRPHKFLPMRAEPFFCHRTPQSGSDKAFGSHDPADRSALLKGFPVHGPAVLASNRINQRTDTASLPALSANPAPLPKKGCFSAIRPDATMSAGRFQSIPVFRLHPSTSAQTKASADRKQIFLRQSALSDDTSHCPVVLQVRFLLLLNMEVSQSLNTGSDVRCAPPIPDTLFHSRAPTRSLSSPASAPDR